RGRRLSSPADAYLSPRWLIWMPEDVTRLVGQLPGAIAAELAEWRRLLDDSSRPLLHRMRTLDATTYMPGAVLAKVDRMSMRHSLEVRSPLLDKAVAEFAMGVSEESCWRAPDETKRILKLLASRYLPPEWMRRRKMGFGLPSNAWSAPQLMGMARDLLLSRDGRTAELVDRAALEALVEHQSSPSNFSIYRVWPLLVLELWLRRMSSAPSEGAKASGRAESRGDERIGASRGAGATAEASTSALLRSGQ
ncbi:MAG: hypothetical protein FJ253_08580, partial [Phycisphaerae bacterium]|nr:hypothetical protein [Phycisphaerae bacterium]